MVARISKSNKATTMKSILTRLHLQQYLPTFQKHDIDITIFLTLNEQTLKIIGIKNESHRKILIIWIKKLQQLLLTSTNNNNDISTLTINTKKILSEINNDDKDYDEEGGEEEEEEEDDDDQIIIDEQLILATVQNNNKKLLTPITEEDSDESSSFFFNNNNNNNNNSDDGDDGDDGDDSKSDVGIILNSATPQIIDYNSTVPIPEYSEVDLINTQRSNDENHDDINEIDVNDNNTHYFYHNPQSAISTSTLATSASITTLPSYTPFTTSTLLRSLSKTSSRSSKSSKLTKLSLSSRIFNGGPTIVESEDSNNNNDNNNSSSNNNNNMIVNNINNRSKNKIKHQSVLNPKNWRHSMPLIPSISSLLPSSSLSSVQSSSPPSYFDIVVDDYNDKKSDHQSDIIALATNDKSKYNVDCDDEENELLPEYSCTVNHSGYVLIKKEFTRKGLKATKRSWQKRYLYLWGTFLRIYAHEPVNINIAKPIHRFSMQDAQVELAIDYPKRKYVLRIKFKTGHQYLIHADDKEECVTWIERLQSSCNISSTLDERQMPMFITLPTRRRNNGGNISSGIDSTNIIHNDGYDNYSTSFAPTSLTYQRFNEIAREIQQVQITNSSINYQLSW